MNGELQKIPNNIAVYDQHTFNSPVCIDGINITITLINTIDFI